MDDISGKKGNKKKSPEDILSTLEILSTNVETINQQLANSGMNAAFFDKLKEFLPYITKILQYLTQETLKMQKAMVEMNGSMQVQQKKNSQAVDNLNKSLAAQNTKLEQYLNNLQPTQEKLNKTLVGSNAQFASKINQMIDIHMKEISLLKKQNESFIEKMDSLESAIKQLIEKK